MKNIMKYLGLALALVLVSCDEDPIIYKGDANPLIAFSQTTYNLEIVIDDTGALDIPVNASALSSTDRTFNILVDMDATDAIAGSYTLPATVTIPANEYTGTLSISGTDVAGVDTNAKTLVIDIEAGSGYTTGPSATISIYQVCPIPATYFTGSYFLADLVPVFNGANWDPQDVDVVVASATSRNFDATFFGNDQNVTINLVCNELVFATTFDSGFVTSPGNPIIIEPAPNNTSTYDVSDDSAFNVDYQNIAGEFGAYPGSFFMLKN